ncbi:hypothetical protein [Paludisphaera rhizosphaerae]|uniref:hypothetical protein n=1 Tax=Paludisphaera rhizosphaerae TaxID=2711216 RepID=UPI0013EBB523|nr:hypothetical protein [Paludisphaera rhizosphaerae]
MSPVRWLFAPQADPTPRRTILWWEVRRLPVNLVVGAYGVVCLAIFFWGLSGSGELKPGEDAVEPLALLAAPIMFDVCYTLGWVVEALARRSHPDLPRWLGPLLMALGLAFSLAVVTMPAAFWGGYRCLQIVGGTE